MMARPESPVDYTVPALGMLAEYLRRLRISAGLSYGELAVRSKCSAAHLKRAASGRTLPARPVMLAYVDVRGTPGIACTPSSSTDEL
ncbi:helix-turn-helix domain-containing protein [Streptomyces griseorubiginosus]